MKEPFAILHELEDTQCLITSKWDPDSTDFHIDIKFWCTPMNGYINLQLGYREDQEEVCKEVFEKFKAKENAIEWIEKFEKQYC